MLVGSFSYSLFIAVPPKPPLRTSKSVRFIAVHISKVRIIPDAPTKAPATIKIILFTINPADIAAIPESEFKNAMTTGISAPPITATLITPPINETKIINSINKSSISKTTGINIIVGKNTENISANFLLKLFNLPRSFITATRLPENVNIPITIEKIATKTSEIGKELPESST